MKNTVCLITGLVAAALAAGAEEAPVMTNLAQKASYAMGYEQGSAMVKQDSGIDPLLFSRAIVDGMTGKPSALDPETSKQVSLEFRKEMQTKYQARMEKDAVENQAAAMKFLAENKKKPDVKETASGLQYQVTKEGDGKAPQLTDVVKVHYTGTLLNGEVFDSSVERGQPATFPLRGVIKGWQEGLQLMKVGSKYRFVIPPDLAYGKNGSPPRIGPNSALIFDVELLEVKEAGPAGAPPRPAPGN